MLTKLAFVNQYYCFHSFLCLFFVANMRLTSLCQILCILFFYRLNAGLSLPSSTHGTNFTQWSEDDWLETHIPMKTQFMFNRQPYENIIIRTRMNEWSLELSCGNKSNLNTLWTELNLFLARRYQSTSFNNSIRGHVRHGCHPPVVSPITNDSTLSVPELAEVDRLIAKYFINDGFFRTINFINCTIDEQRRNPSMHMHINIYLVTNREFQSLVYVKMSNVTRSLLTEHSAKIYIHNYDKNFRYNFDVSDIDRPLNSDSSFSYMIKLYNSTQRATSGTTKVFSNGIIIILLLFIFF